MSLPEDRSLTVAARCIADNRYPQMPSFAGGDPCPCHPSTILNTCRSADPIYMHRYEMGPGQVERVVGSADPTYVDYTFHSRGRLCYTDADIT